MSAHALGPVGTNKKRDYLVVVTLDLADVVVHRVPVDLKSLRDVLLRLVGNITEVDFFDLGLWNVRAHG